MLYYIPKGGVSVLSYIRLRNFKSFSDIMFDLRGKGGIPKKKVFVYGENGSGKSNLISSLFFLRKTVESMRRQTDLKKITDVYLSEEYDKTTILNERRGILEDLIKNTLYTSENLIKEYKTINSEGGIEIEVGFFLGGVDGTYSLSFDDARVVREELRYKLNERTGTVFQLSEGNIRMSKAIFFDDTYSKELKQNIEKYWGMHTFMSILDNETATKNNKFIELRVHKNMLDILKWFQGYSVSCREAHLEKIKPGTPFSLFRDLESGYVRIGDDKELFTLEKLLNNYFTSLYSDVKKVYYKFETKEGRLQYKLYLKKLLNGSILDIPFELESTGTRKLLSILPYILSAVSGKTVFIDEIDGGIHDLLMCEVIESLGDALDASQTGQLIATTHNTRIMKQLANDDVYILSIDVDGNKNIFSVDKYDFRTQKTHSIQSKYLNGDYAGVPFTGYLDFSEMVEEIEACI